MSIFDIGFHIRTQSSYEFSLASSRQQKFFSGQSLIIDERQQSHKKFTSFFNLNQKQQNNFSSMQRLLESHAKLVSKNSKTQYIVMREFQQSQQEQISPVIKHDGRRQSNKKKQMSNTLAIYPNYAHHYHNKLSLASLPLSTLNVLNSYKRCSVTPLSDLLNHAYGAMFGFVIGDSIGSYLVHQNVTEISDICTALEMKNGGRFSLSQGQGTDQTQIFIALSDGLLESLQQGDYDNNIIAKRYFDWIESKPFDFPTLAAISFSQIRKQRQIQSNGSINISSLGQSLIRGSQRNINHQSSLSLIRIIPLVLASIHNSEERLIYLIKRQMNFFTPNLFGTQVAILYGLLLRIIIQKHDHEYAIFYVSKWVYNNGSSKLIQLWRLFQQGKQLTINPMNMNQVSVPFLFALNEINKKQINFVDSLVKILIKGFNTDTNCSIVMGLVGAAIGLNRIPNFFKNKVIDCQVEKSKRLRDKKYCSSRIVQLVPKLIDRGQKYQQKGFKQ